MFCIVLGAIKTFSFCRDSRIFLEPHPERSRNCTTLFSTSGLVLLGLRCGRRLISPRLRRSRTCLYRLSHRYPVGREILNDLHNSAKHLPSLSANVTN